MTEFTCFNEYDVRGELGINFDEGICYKISRAFASVLAAKTIVIGRDARESSPHLANCIADGLRDSGVDVFDLGLCGTEEMYWAVNDFNACGGLQVTASHNPINYNGIKMVKSGARPLDAQTEFLDVKHLAELGSFSYTKRKGQNFDVGSKARKSYVNKIISFLDVAKLKSLKVVINTGHGAAGPTLRAIASELKSQNCKLIIKHINCEADYTFPKGIPDPMNIRTQLETAEAVIREEADFGVALDGDFDRCAIFDEKGTYVKGECLVGLLAKYFLQKSPADRIAYDRRVIWNIEDIINEFGGRPVPTAIGHTNFKAALRSDGAIYGGEMSHHHYFRDFAFCDSGMIPWLLIAQILSGSQQNLSNLIEDRVLKFPSSGENNFKLSDPLKAIERVVSEFAPRAISKDNIDGVSLSFDTWRFNIRCSNTEPLVRLNIEARGDNRIVAEELANISALLLH